MWSGNNRASAWERSVPVLPCETIDDTDTMMGNVPASGEEPACDETFAAAGPITQSYSTTLQALDPLFVGDFPLREQSYFTTLQDLDPPFVGDSSLREQSSGVPGVMHYPLDPSTDVYHPMQMWLETPAYLDAPNQMTLFGTNARESRARRAGSTISEVTAALDGSRLKCNWCPKEFTRPADRRKHEKVHADTQDREHRCELCNSTFLYAKDLDRHKTTVHPSGDEPVFLCHISSCARSTVGNGFLRKDKLIEHLSKSHQISQPSRYKDLTKNESEAVCVLCGNIFSGEYKSGNLKRHMRVKHGGVDDQRLNCRACEKSFTRSDACRKHEWRTHQLADCRPERRMIRPRTEKEGLEG